MFRRDIEGDDLYDGAVARDVPYTPLGGEFYLEETEHRGELLPIDEDEYGTYIMNARDMCLLDYLPLLRDAGVVSFKVEGRSKTINYLAGVGRAYRRAIDAVERGESYDALAYAEDIFAISNRGYTAGFLVGDPREKGIYYEKNREYHEEDFIGIVRERTAEGLYRIEVKNRFEVGQTLKVVNPDHTTTWTLMDIRTADGESVDVAHGGGRDVYIALPEDMGDFAILRRRATPDTPLARHCEP